MNQHSALLTGASGFIGAHLYQALLADDQWVVHTQPRASRNDDVLLADSVVFHLAGLAHAGARSGARDTLFEVNVAQTCALFAKALDAGARRFVWLSSSKVLGEESSGPLKPDEPMRPEGLYAESKAAGEEALQRYAALHNAEDRLCIIRPPLVYGPGVKANFLSLVKWALSGLPLPLAEARALRSWVSVQNLVELVLILARHEDRGPDGTVWHVSDNADASVADIIRLIAAAAESKPRLMTVSPRWLYGAARIIGRDAAARRLLGSLQLDVSSTVAALGWQPGLPVEQGIEKVVQWYLTQR